MKDSEFRGVIAGLREEFGNKQYSERICGMIWGVVKNISLQEFERGIERCFEHSNKPPSVSTIKAACIDAIRREDEAIKAKIFMDLKEKFGGCSYCELTGMMTAISKIHPMEQPYTFKCPKCVAARHLKLSNDIPDWFDKYELSFMPIEMTADGIRAMAVARKEHSEIQRKKLSKEELRDLPKLLRSFAPQKTEEQWRERLELKYGSAQEDAIENVKDASEILKKIKAETATRIPDPKDDIPIPDELPYFLLEGRDDGEVPF